MPIHDWTKVNPGLFHHFHQLWMANLTNALNSGVLPACYFALIEQSTAGVIPDILSLRIPEPDPDWAGGSVPSGVSVTTPPPQPRFVLHSEAEAYARKASRIAVRQPLGDVVAVIEVVSPGNKAGKAALRAFVEKAADLIQQGVHLLVIDLFPPTPRDPQGIARAIWDQFEEGPFEPTPDKPLTIASFAAGPIRPAYTDPVAVGDPQPEMPLFLEPERSVSLPLEPSYQKTWDACPRPFREALG